MEMRTLSNRLKATLRGGGALLLCLCLTACSSSDDEENVGPQLQVSPVALSFDRDEGDAETLSLQHGVDSHGKRRLADRNAGKRQRQCQRGGDDKRGKP